jgi:hypothetical protein
MSDIPNEIRIRLKQLYPDPDPGIWDWDEGQWDWELSLRDNGDPGTLPSFPSRMESFSNTK